MLQGVIVPCEFLARRHTFLSHNSFQGSKPMVVIGFAGIRVTGRVRPLDLAPSVVVAHSVYYQSIDANDDLYRKNIGYHDRKRGDILLLLPSQK